jgi:hypothetical protein
MGLLGGGPCQKAMRGTFRYGLMRKLLECRAQGKGDRAQGRRAAHAGESSQGKEN